MRRAALAAFAVILGFAGCTPSAGVGDERSAPAPSPSSPSVASRASASSPRVITLPSRAAPVRSLVVMLHGVGADASGFQAIAEALASALPHAEFLVPDGFHPFDGDATGRQWFSLRGATDENRAARVREGGREVSAWLDEELRRRGLGGDRLALVGFSQGAMVAAWLALHRESHPAAVVLFSGLVAEDSSPTQTDVATPILLVHGERDARIPVASVEPSLRTLESFGARVDKRVYPGLGHAIDERALRDARAFLRGKLEPAQL